MAISRKTGLCAFIVLVIGFLAVQGGPRVSFAQDGHLRESVFQLSGTSDINNGFAKILVLLQFTVPSGRGRAVIEQVSVRLIGLGGGPSYAILSTSVAPNPASNVYIPLMEIGNQFPLPPPFGSGPPFGTSQVGTTSISGVYPVRVLRRRR